MAGMVKDRAARITGLGWVGAALLATAYSAAGEPAVPLRTVIEVSELSLEEAAKGRHVRIEAVVTYYHHAWEMLFVQDQTGALFVYVPSDAPRWPIREGSLIELRGTTVAGEFLASVTQPQVTVLGEPGLPEARPVTPGELARDEADSEWVEIQGVVRHAAIVDGLLDLSLAVDGDPVRVRVREYADGIDPASLEDAVVRIRGVSSALTEEERQYFAGEVWSPDLARNVTVLEPPPRDAFAIDVTPIGSLQSPVFAQTHRRRVKVRGTATLLSGRSVFVQGDNAAVRVEARSAPQVRPGDLVEAAGYLDSGGHYAVLVYGVLRRVGTSQEPAPLRPTIADILNGSTRGRLSTVEGIVESSILDAERPALILRRGDIGFYARLAEGSQPGDLLHLEPGSWVEVTGVCSPTGGRATRPFEVMIQGEAHVRLLKRPSWWTTARIQRLLGLTVLIAILAFAWVVTLRRQVHRQVCDLHDKEATLRESEERYALALRGTNDGVWDWDLQSDSLYLSPRWREMLGYAEGDLPSTSRVLVDLVNEEDRPRFEEKLRLHRDGATPLIEDEHRVRHKDGTYRWMLCRGFAQRDAHGRAVRLIGALTDVTDRRAYDPLTKLPNRALFAERLERVAARASRSRRSFAVLFLDLDRFKLINDSLGHAVGDHLLMTCAERLESCLRPSDMIARFGGDEFAVLIEDIDNPTAAARVAERIIDALQAPLTVRGIDTYVSASIGIALGPSPAKEDADLLRDADTAMYRAKANGGARFEVFDAAMRERVTALMHTEHDLRRSLGRDELRLHYQPICDLSGRIVALEALLRWQHPERGLLAPGDFLHVAEETGLIVPIGEWSLGAACAQARSWRDLPGGRDAAVCVNLSARQLGHRDVVRHVERVLGESGLPPRGLILEITESLLVENVPSATQRLDELQRLGVRIQLDDFGTGYSSLSYLHRLPIEALKIDRSFVDGMTKSDDILRVVRSIIALANNLRLGVIGEGVETTEQLEALRELECALVQGFLLSPPVEPAAIPSLLATGLRRNAPS